MKKITLMIFTLLVTGLTWGQCINTTAYLTPTAANDGTVEQIATCTYSTEYNTINGLIIGDDYQFVATVGGVDAYVTITDAADEVLAFGPSPLDVTGIIADVVRLHVTADAACTGGSICHITSFQNLTVAANTCFDPTALASPLQGEETADLTWAAGGPADADYDVAVFTMGADPATATAVYTENVVGATMTTATGLSPLTMYDFYVTTNCGGVGTSTQVGPVTFETLSASAPECPANVMSTPDAACGNFDVPLSWDASTGATGYRISVGTTMGGTDVENLTDLGTNLNYTIVTPAPGTTYYFTVVAYNAVGDSVGCTENTVETAAAPCYCDPSSTNTNTTTFIDNVSTTGGTMDISNLGSGLSAGHYVDNFDTMSVSSYANGAFNFTVEIQGGTLGLAIWVDWNNDYTYDMATETVYNTTAYGNGPFTGTITVPAGTANGDYHMRIMADWNDANPAEAADTACELNFGRGETEDYKVTVEDAPACVPPSGTAISNLMDVSADFTWSMGGTEDTWEYANVESPSTDPASGTSTMTASYSALGLTPETAYDFYVRSDCGGGLYSTWIKISYTTPATPPANDECDNATALTVNADLACGEVTAGTNVAATMSAQADDVSGTPSKDVWFSFVATSTQHVISLLNVTAVVGTATDMGMGLYDATSGCASLVFSSTSDPNSYTATGLVVGNSYVLRVYGWSTFNGGAQANFDVCVGTLPEAPENDECATAVGLTVNADLACTSVTSGTIASATDSGIDNCGGTEDDDVWYSFVATGTTHTVDLLNITGGTTDLYHAVYDATPGCATLGAALTCSDPNNSTTSGLTPGNTYLVQVYSWTATTGQTSSFDICIGTPPAPPANDECDDAVALTVNADSSCTSVTAGTIASATNSGVDNCGGTEDDDVWYSFVATADTHTVDLLNITGGTTDLYHAVYDAAPGCATLGAALTCSDPNNSTTSGLTPGNTYLVQVYSWTATAGQTSNFDICIGTPPPVNDDCGGAIALTFGVEVSVDTTTATQSTATSTCDTASMNDVWYSFTATAASSTVTVTTSADQFAIHTDCATAAATSCTTDGVEVSGLVDGTTYYIRVWNDGTPTFAPDGPITLTVSVGTLSTPSFNNELLFTYYPNPVNNNLTLNAQKEISNVGVYNMLGQEVIRTTPNNVTNEVNMSSLQAGAYFVRVTIGDVTETVRVLKN